jgi:hypothetical protein
VRVAWTETALPGVWRAYEYLMDFNPRGAVPGLIDRWVLDFYRRTLARRQRVHGLDVVDIILTGAIAAAIAAGTSCRSIPLRLDGLTAELRDVAEREPHAVEAE